MLLRTKTVFMVAFLSVVFTTSHAWCAELTLMHDSSTIRYQVTKYGTMMVEGVLKEPSSAGLSGQMQVEQADALVNVSGDLVLLRPVFDSQHVRRDDEVNKLFLTPVKLAVTTRQPCNIKSGECEFTAVIALNDRTERFNLVVYFYKKKERLQVDGAFVIKREQFNLVFTEGFAGTLDMAVAQNVKILFRLSFAPDDISVLDDVPIKSLIDVSEEGQTNKASWSERVQDWVEEFWK